MVLRRLLFSILVLQVCREILARECSDCQKYTECKPAADLALNQRNDETKMKFQQAHCGFDEVDEVFKVCCSDFEITLPNLLDRSGGAVETATNKQKNYSDKLKLLPENCGDIEGSRIVGGKVAKLYEFPWMALISYNTRLGLQFKCSGSIINSRYILTAAHCVQGEDIAGVRVGEFDTRYKTDCQGEQADLVCETHLQDVTVEESIMHENFQTLPSVKNDIALLRLQEDIDFNHKNVGPICLPVPANLRNKILTGERATVAGWGLTETGRESSVLLKVLVPIKSEGTCRGYYNRQATNDDDRTVNQFCAGDLSKDSCNGDSGGPLMMEDEYNNVDRFVQFGIVSHGPRKCGSNFPGIYTDVRKFVDWILENIKP